jgi:hypothetical protein
MRYLKGWFWLDAPASVPVELLDLVGETPSSLGFLRVLRMFRLVRLSRSHAPAPHLPPPIHLPSTSHPPPIPSPIPPQVRLFKLLKIDAYLEALEDMFDTSLRSLRVVILVVRIGFLAHIMGCFWCAHCAARDATCHV